MDLAVDVGAFKKNQALQSALRFYLKNFPGNIMPNQRLSLIELHVLVKIFRKKATILKSKNTISGKKFRLHFS
jgi:hypothetical protein